MRGGRWAYVEGGAYLLDARRRLVGDVTRFWTACLTAGVLVSLCALFRLREVSGESWFSDSLSYANLLQTRWKEPGVTPDRPMDGGGHSGLAEAVSDVYDRVEALVCGMLGRAADSCTPVDERGGVAVKKAVSEDSSGQQSECCTVVLCHWSEGTHGWYSNTSACIIKDVVRPVDIDHHGLRGAEKMPDLETDVKGLPRNSLPACWAKPHSTVSAWYLISNNTRFPSQHQESGKYFTVLKCSTQTQRIYAIELSLLRYKSPRLELHIHIVVLTARQNVLSFWWRVWELAGFV